jgi:hypothetical protein
VQKEAAGLRQHSREQHASGEPLEPVREVGARQVEQVDERQDQEHAGVGVSCAEEALLPVGQSLAAGEEREQGPAAVFDAHERDDRHDREGVRRFHEAVRRPWSVMELISVRQP